jgi:hypothetical protein
LQTWKKGKKPKTKKLASFEVRHTKAFLSATTASFPASQKQHQHNEMSFILRRTVATVARRTVSCR